MDNPILRTYLSYPFPCLTNSRQYLTLIFKLLFKINLTHTIKDPIHPMLPIVEVPKIIDDYFHQYRDSFCRKEGFGHVSRYITGLILSPNKTFQGIYDNQVWIENKPSRRAMHDAIFRNNWDSEGIMSSHRKIVNKSYKGIGLEVISIDWTYSHHDRGPKIYANKKNYDHVQKRNTLYQTVVTAVISNNHLIDGIEVVVQEPSYIKEEMAYLNATSKKEYTNAEDAKLRLLELLNYRHHEISYKKRTEIACDIANNIESEKLFKNANYCFDNGVLCHPLSETIKTHKKQWTSEIEKTRKILWNGQWTAVQDVGDYLRSYHPESFRFMTVKCRNGDKKQYWAFSKVVRLKKYGRLRLVIVHEKEDLSDKPRYLISSARHWEAKKVIRTWSYRWSCETFHEFAKQRTGFESAQLRNEEAVKRHFRLSCIAQSLIQRVISASSTSERFRFDQENTTVGLKCRTIARETFRSLLTLIERLFGEKKDIDEVLDLLMPA